LKITEASNSPSKLKTSVLPASAEGGPEGRAAAEGHQQIETQYGRRQHQRQRDQRLHETPQEEPPPGQGTGDGQRQRQQQSTGPDREAQREGEGIPVQGR
jgi:hypothetical protein